MRWTIQLESLFSVDRNSLSKFFWFFRGQFLTWHLLNAAFQFLQIGGLLQSQFRTRHSHSSAFLSWTLSYAFVYPVQIVVIIIIIIIITIHVEAKLFLLQHSGGFRGATGGSCPSLAELKQVWRPFWKCCAPFEELAFDISVEEKTPPLSTAPSDLLWIRPCFNMIPSRTTGVNEGTVVCPLVQVSCFQHGHVSACWLNLCFFLQRSQ